MGFCEGARCWLGGDGRAGDGGRSVRCAARARELTADKSNRTFHNWSLTSRPSGVTMLWTRLGGRSKATGHQSLFKFGFSFLNRGYKGVCVYVCVLGQGERRNRGDTLSLFSDYIRLVSITPSQTQHKEINSHVRC